METAIAEQDQYINFGMQEKETLNTLNCDSFEHTKPTSGFMPEFEFLHLHL